MAKGIIWHNYGNFSGITTHYCMGAAILVQPSSAASERVFSLLSETFGKRQNNSPEDYVESCII